MKSVRLLCILCMICTLSAAIAAAENGAGRQNGLGLIALKKGRFAEAVSFFDAAYKSDPTYHIALFNSACASSRNGDAAEAKKKIEQYLLVLPNKVTKVLHDPDLALIRQDKAWLDTIRHRVRPKDKKVRPIVFERRDTGADLYIASEDGLDIRVLAADPNLREHDASFLASGEYVVFLAGKSNYENSVYYDFKQSGGQILHEPDDELRSVSMSTGKQIVLGERVHHYQLSEDKKNVLFVDRPENERKKNGVLRIRKVSVKGGTPSTLAEIDVTAAVWCIVEKDEGIVVVEGMPHPGWLTGLRLRVLDYSGGTRTEILPTQKTRPVDPKIFGFPACVLSSDKTKIDLGNAVVKLGNAPGIERTDGLAFGEGAYIDRRKGERAGVVRTDPPEFFITVDGDALLDEEYDGAVFPPLWKTSSLSVPLSNGMGPDCFFRTKIRHVFRTGMEMQTLTEDKVFSEYGPAVSMQNDRVAFTRLATKNGTPWIYTADLDGKNERPVAPGQYPTWGPVPVDIDSLPWFVSTTPPSASTGK